MSYTSDHRSYADAVSMYRNGDLVFETFCGEGFFEDMVVLVADVGSYALIMVDKPRGRCGPETRHLQSAQGCACATKLSEKTG